MNNNLMLLNDCCGFATVTLLEAAANGRSRFRGKLQEANAINKNKRMYPFEVLSKNVETLQAVVEERGLYGELDHPCLTSSDFRVLTTEGWKEFKNIKESDYVLSRANGRITKSKVKKVIKDNYKGKVYNISNANINSTFTAPHKLLLKKRQDVIRDETEVYVTASEVFENRSKYKHHSIPRTATWTGNDDDTIYINGIVFETKSFMTLLGLYLSSGTIGEKMTFIRVKNSKEEAESNTIEKWLKNISPELKWEKENYGFYTKDERLYNYFKSIDNRIPREVKQLSSENLEKLIYWFGNEQKIKNNPEEFSSYSKELIDDLHECVIKTGRCATQSVSSFNKQPVYNLRINKTENISLDNRTAEITEQDYEGKIYCLTTQHGNFYMEQNNHCFWTGNCDSIVHLNNVSHLITKLWWEGNVLMGEGEILPTPSGIILKKLIESDCRIGMSSRGVGNGQTNNEGVLVIGDQYKLICFDCVADPSTNKAFQKMVDGKNESYQIPQIQKEESLNSKALVSYVGVNIDLKVEELKRGIRNKVLTESDLRPRLGGAANPHGNAKIKVGNSELVIKSGKNEIYLPVTNAEREALVRKLNAFMFVDANLKLNGNLLEVSNAMDNVTIKVDNRYRQMLSQFA